MIFLVDYFTYSHYTIIFKAWLVETKTNTGDLDSGEKLIKIMSMLYPSFAKMKEKNFIRMEIFKMLKSVFEDIFEEDIRVEGEVNGILHSAWRDNDNALMANLKQPGAEEDDWSEADKDEKASVTDSWTSEESAWSVVDEKRCPKLNLIPGLAQLRPSALQNHKMSNPIAKERPS